MSKLLRLAAATELGLKLVELAFHPAWLPLCGSEVAQIAICFGAAGLLNEVWGLVNEVRASWGPSVHRTLRRISEPTREMAYLMSGAPHLRARPALIVSAGYRGPDRRTHSDRRSSRSGGRRSDDLQSM